jgi:hypothetical protein
MDNIDPLYLLIRYHGFTSKTTRIKSSVPVIFRNSEVIYSSHILLVGSGASNWCRFLIGGKASIEHRYNDLRGRSAVDMLFNPTITHINRMRHFAPEHLPLWIIPEAHSHEENQFAPSLQTSHKLDGIKHKNCHN